MYKLTFRIWLALVSVIVFIAASYFSMKQFPEAVAGVPGVVVILAALVAPILVAFLAFAKGTAQQKITVAAIGIAAGLLYGVAGNVNFGTTKLLPNFQLLINEYLLGILALGGALTALASCALKPAGEVASAVKRSGPSEVVIPDKEETATKSSSTKLPAQSEPLTKSPASTSSTNLKGILDNLAPDDDSSTDLPIVPAKTGLAGSLPGVKSAAPAPAKQPEPIAPVTPIPPTPTTPVTSPVAEAAPAAGTSPTDSQSNLPGQKKATTGTVASSTATRLQAQKRKSTSTFTKLQALSASGTGGIRQKPLETSGGDNDADSLKSILDRLDTKQEDAYSAPDEVEMDSLFGQESLLSPPEVSENEHVSIPEPTKPEPPKPAPTPETVKKPEPPKPVITPDAPKPVTPAPKPNAPAASTAPKPSTSKPYDSPLAKKPEAAPSLSSMLDSLDAAKPATSSSPAAKASNPGTAGGAAAKPLTPTSTPKPALAPPKPAPPVVPRTPTPTSTPKPVEVPKPAAKVEPTPKVEPKAEPKPAAKEPIKSELVKEETGLFETGLDKEIDDIFFNLVPAEAQKTVETKGEAVDEEPAATIAEVAHEPAYEPTPEPAYEAAKEPVAEVEEPAVSELVSKAPEREGGVFESTKVDQELDDIFSNLVPAEAQREVVKSEAKPAEQAKKIEEKKVEEKKVEAKPVEEKKPVVETKKPEPKPVAEPVRQPEPAKSESMFEESGLDRELDDIFSNLAPSEAQRSVTNETLARVRAADATGDHPAITPENMMRERSAKSQEEMSFAPPSDQAQEETTDEHDVDSAKSGKFTETLHAMPSLQATVEGLLNNLASSEMVKTETESFAPPEAKSGNGSGVATKVLDLIESLESSHESQAAHESAEAAAESSTGDIVSDLFDTSSKEAEAHDELVTESVVEESPEAVEESTSEVLEEEPAGYKYGIDDFTKGAETVADEAESTNQEATVAEEATEAAEVVEAAESNEAVEEASEIAEAVEVPATPTAAESEANRKTAKELKEFGRLSSKQGGTEFASETAGTMKTIGKLLIEVQAVENIIKAGESGTIGSGLTTARVISAARGEGIKALLSKIDSYSGVDGSVIVGHDGLVIASTAGPGMDKDTLGVLSVACLSTSNLATKKLEIGKLRQMVLVTDAKTTVLTDVDVGILAVFLDNNDVGKIDGLLEAIHDTIHG